MNGSNNIEHIDFELDQFLQELFHEVNALTYSEDEGTSKENAFTEYIMEILEEAGETEGTKLCPYIKENKWENIQFKINGYAIEEGFETLDIFISSYHDSPSLVRLPKSDLDKIIKWTSGFVNVSLKGYFEEIEPSSEAHGLAKAIFDKKNEFVRINIFIISNGNIPHDPPINFRIKGYDDLVFNFNIWDAERLHRLSQTRNNREPIIIDFEGNLGQSIPCLSMPSQNDLYECYLAIVPGSILATLYRNYGTRLLESNVRAFLQQTGKVNQGIRDTIRDEPYMFLPYNNGLATTAQEVQTRMSDDGQLLITGVKDFQIVNGGQTTASIFHTEKKFKSDISQVFVQMKLTVIKDEDKKNETVPFISRYANSQNKVSELDLTSNNPFLQRIEELSRTTYAVDPTDPNKQTIWFFERVKGQYREALNKEPTKGKKDAYALKYPRNQLIIKSEVAKYLNTWNQKPFHVSKGAQKNYNFFLKEVEDQFKKAKPNRNYWQDIVANAILFKTTDSLFGRKNQDPIGDTNIRSHTVTYSLSYIHYLTDNRLNLELIWDEQLVREDLKHEIKRVLIYVYGFLSSLDAALISEAAKAEKTWNLLKEKQDFKLDYVIIDNHLVSTLYDVKTRYKTLDEGIQETKKYNDLNRITSLGLKFWDGLSLFNISNSVLSQFQGTIVSKVARKLQFSGSISEREIEKAIEVLDTLSEKGIEFDKIALLSKLEKDEIIDASSLFNRLVTLSDNDWSRIISLGEQTESLTFNEISVIRSVMSKIKHKEDIDFKRLEIVESALKKLKRFGVKY